MCRNCYILSPGGGSDVVVEVDVVVVDSGAVCKKNIFTISPRCLAKMIYCNAHRIWKTFSSNYGNSHDIARSWLVEQVSPCTHPCGYASVDIRSISSTV